MENEISVASLSPVHFFNVSVDCHYFDPGLDGGQIVSKRYLLPNTSMLCLEERFAEVYLGWNPQGLLVAMKMNWPLGRSCLPNVTDGDALEVFIATRFSNAPAYNNRFCHHFFALPTAVDGVQAGEKTRFRTEDSHPLCSGDDLYVEYQKSWRHPILLLKIPAFCLHGYDPQQFDQLGFTYRISRSDALPQHFSVCSDDFPFEQHPALWAQVRLIP